MKVLKFGGSVLKDVGSLEKIRRIVVNEGQKDLVVVVSAFNGVTDKLIESANSALKNMDTYKDIIERQKGILYESGIRKNLLNDIFEEFIRTMESVKVYKEINAKILDYIMAFGERFAAMIVSEYLNNSGLKTKCMEGHQIGIITDSNFGNAKPLMSSYKAISSLLHNIDYIPVITGFIGKDIEGNYTTLGRNGSDFTAAVISYACGAEYLKIYSDVDGILSGNPNFIKNARAVDELSLAEYQELEYWLKRIHPHMLSSVIEKNIPLIILNADNPSFGGTRISYKSSSEIPKLLVFRDDVFFNIIEIPKDKSYMETSKVLINYFFSNNIKPLFFDIRNAQISFMLPSSKKVSDIINSFHNEYIIYTYIDRIAVKIVGENINKDMTIVNEIMKIAQRYGINIRLISYVSGIHSCIFIIDRKDGYIEFLNELHDDIILK